MSDSLDVQHMYLRILRINIKSNVLQSIRRIYALNFRLNFKVVSTIQSSI